MKSKIISISAITSALIAMFLTFGVYVEVFDTVVDNYTNKWLCYGFDEQTL